MGNLTDLVDRYFSMWNETDAKRRRDLIAQTWTEAANYLDPVAQGEGRKGIDTMVQGIQERFPGYRFRRTSEVDGHHDRVRFGWELGPEDGPALAGGIDFGVVVDGRLETVTGFLDFAPKPAG
ncbi:MAG: nuclear transport factor 2 family protein [Chloroflexi bacterium]|nr:nuclear transport factor 2 family protein [Chloroflexota bacterium]